MPPASLRFRVLTLCALAVALLAPAQAQDRPIDRDLHTGVVVAPGASTWTAEAFDQKKTLMSDTAAAQGRTCAEYAFLGWPPAAGDTEKVMAETRRNYEAAGYTVQQKPAEIPTDSIWLVAKDGRGAVILWSNVAGSTIYLSCTTADSLAADPSKPIILGIVLALGLGATIAGLWLHRRASAPGQVSRRRPTIGLGLATVGALVTLIGIVMLLLD
jgi:hypothetical protein